MNPFRNILRLSVGDVAARALSFLAFIYMARVLGVDGYGTVEFALSLIIYLQAFTEGGLDLWATREIARGKDIRILVSQVVPLRLILGSAGFIGLLLFLPLFPDYPQLKLVLILFGLRAFTQALDLRWVFMGQEKMKWVAIGLIISQVVFALAVFGLVRGPEDILWIPIFQTIGNLAMAGYFIYQFLRSTPGGTLFRPTLRGIKQALGPSFTLGASRGLSLLSFNFDTLLIGFMLSSATVGLYSAAYRPVIVVLTIATTYGLGLFPVLSRAFATDHDEFRRLVRNSLRLTATLAMPIGIAGTFLAKPGIELLFGSEYSEAAPVLQILSWTAVLVTLRGTFRQSLCAIGHQRVDLWNAVVASVINVSLNFVLIPKYGMIGAAIATVISEIVWVSFAMFTFTRLMGIPKLMLQMVNPLMAGAVMVVTFLVTSGLVWPAQAVIASIAYLGMIFITSENKNVKSWIRQPRIEEADTV